MRSRPDFDRMVADLERLGEMHQKGLLTDDEFQTLKKKILIELPSN
ncbi:MAG: SHOCT domain-containing protein [Burkholderiaceae bacterium]|nr:SHOCT domain-containing protein [Burkholderiaceae bacterium]